MSEVVVFPRRVRRRRPTLNEALLFEAFTDRIPPLETRVLVTLKPQLKPAGE